MTMDWQSAPASPSSFTVKRILRLEIPVDTYPNVSFYAKASYSNSFDNLIRQLLLSFLELKDLPYLSNKSMLFIIASV